MELKVIYIGNDEGYWYKIHNLFKKKYESISFTFSEIAGHKDLKPKELFIKLYEERPQVILIDFEYEFKIMISLAKLLNRNNEMRLVALIGLYSVNQETNDMIQGISAAIRLNHIKSIEIEDIVYDAISLIDVNTAESAEYSKSEGEIAFEILQPMRIGYIEDNKFHVETNSYLSADEIVDVHSHPLMKIMPSKKVYVEKFFDSGLYYNRRFGYDLEFIYIDDDYFAATNENWKLYKKLKELPEEFEKLAPEIQEEIKSDMEKRREKFTEIKYLIDRWIGEREGRSFAKKLKIMIVDDSLEVFKTMEQSVDKFPYSISFQTVLMSDSYQIKRSMPHFIVFRLSEEGNTYEMLTDMIKRIREQQEYEPIILVFGCDKTTEDMRIRNKYEKLMVRSEDVIDVNSIKGMAKSLDERLQISQEENARVFFKASDPDSVMFLKKIVRIYAMTESELIMYSELPVPLYTVFLANSPVKVFLTVVPHKDNSAYANQEGYYRCLINGAGESEKAALRRVVNSTLKEDETSEEDP